jgi:hypothetical protein
MTCPGLHCPGCTEGQSLAITGAAVVGLVLAAEAVQWVAERVLWIGGTMAACLALSVAASMWLEARADRRGRAWGAARGIYSRADVILREPAQSVVVDPVPEYRAIAPVPQVVVNIFGQLDAGQADAIRQAIDGND